MGSASGPAFLLPALLPWVWAGAGVASGALGPGLTSESAAAARAVLRARFSQHDTADLVAELAALRPRPGDVAGYATRVAVRELGRRAGFPGSQLERLDELIVPPRHCPRPRPARLLRRRPGHRRAALGRRRGSP